MALRAPNVCTEHAPATNAAVHDPARYNLQHCPPVPVQVLPADIREPLVRHPQRASLLEVVLDLGRRPEARFLGQPGGQFLREGEVGAARCVGAGPSCLHTCRALEVVLCGALCKCLDGLRIRVPLPCRLPCCPALPPPSLPPAQPPPPPPPRPPQITKEDLAHAEEALGDFGGDNRAGVEGTLHRISGGGRQRSGASASGLAGMGGPQQAALARPERALPPHCRARPAEWPPSHAAAIRNRKGSIVGLTCRVGRAVTGHIDMIRDVLDGEGAPRRQPSSRGSSAARLHVRYSPGVPLPASKRQASAQPPRCSRPQCLRTRSPARCCSWASRAWARRRSSARWPVCCQVGEALPQGAGRVRKWVRRMLDIRRAHAQQVSLPACTLLALLSAWPDLLPTQTS